MAISSVTSDTTRSQSMIRVNDVPTADGRTTVVVEANRRYELGAEPGERRLIDVTGAKGSTAYGFYVDTDEQVVLENVPQLVASEHLRPVDGEPRTLDG